MSIGLSKEPYNAGVKAFKEGKTLDYNPHSAADLRKRCAWAGGWSDAERGFHNEDKQEGSEQ